MPRDPNCCHIAMITHVASPVNLSVAIQHLTPFPLMGNTDPIVMAGNRGEVTGHYYAVIAIVTFSLEGHHTVIAVITVNPLEPFIAKIVMMQCRLFPVNSIEIFYPLLQSSVGREFEQVPVQAGLMEPLVPLTEFPSHKEQLLTGLGIHIAE